MVGKIHVMKLMTKTIPKFEVKIIGSTSLWDHGK